MAKKSSFAANVGGKRTFVLTDVEFVGYGLHMGSLHNDYAGRDVKGKAVVWLGEAHTGFVGWCPRRRSIMESRPVYCTRRDGRSGVGFTLPDFQGEGSVRLTWKFHDHAAPGCRRGLPNLSVSDDVLAFIFSASGLNYEELKAKAGSWRDLTPAPDQGRQTDLQSRRRLHRHQHKDDPERCWLGRRQRSRN